MPAVKFLAVLFAALALVPAGAHLAELPHKIGMPVEQYLVVQQIYRGWALFGFAVIGALVFTGALAWLQRKAGEDWRAALIAFVCILGTQIVFWTHTQPANRATNNFDDDLTL